MANDDDFQSLSLLHQSSSSPQFQPRRLKRLKKRNEDAAVQFAPKSNQKSSSPKLAADDDDEDLILFPKVDFAQLQAMEAALDDDSNPDDSIQPVHSVEKSRSGDGSSSVNTMEGSLELGGDEFLVDVEERRDAKRVLNFEDEDESEKLDTHRVAEEEKMTEDNPIMQNEQVLEKGNSRSDRDDATKEEKGIEKKGKKRSRGDSAVDAKPGKRKLEKERKEHLKQLHAESQRLLRESSDAAFKPTKVMAKSLSDVLEKIRQRKMQFTKKTATVYSAVSNGINRSRDALKVEEESESDAVVKSVDQQLDVASQQPEILHADQLTADCLDVDKSTESVTLPSCDNLPSHKVPDEKSMPLLQPLLDDTEDLFADSHTKDSEDEKLDSQEDSPLEEAFVPSLSVLNVKSDSDDDSSEDDNDKENVDPLSQRSEDSPRRGDPVKAFLDEEAEEEDDSDHDMLRFPENEDDDMEDIEELRGLIATNFEEKPSDNERRNELHQKWLEQQDAAGTDDLLQKLKVGNTSIGLEQEEENEEIEDHDPEDENNTPPKGNTRVHLKNAKEMISRMFGEKDEVYISDEDEEIEKKLVTQRLTVRTEVSVSSVQDESSREVSGLIKKLNIAPENRKKAKTSLYFDSVFKAGNDSGFAKSSFVGRFSSNSLPSCHKKSSGSACSFIFGRDDSNSRNSITPSDDSEDAVLKGNHSFKTSKSLPTRTQAKYSSSSSQSKKGTAESSETKKSHTSLFEVLKRSSSMKAGFCDRGEDLLGLTQVISTFKIPK